MSSEFITVNGKRYKAKEITFNFACDLQDAGISFAEIGKKELPTIRAYVAYCMGVDLDTAGDAINDHLIAGNTMEDIATVLAEKVEDSAFFRALSDKEGTEETSKKNTKRKTAPEVSE